MPEEGEPLPNIDSYPILDQVEAQRIFYARFLKDCGSDDVCDSDLSVKAKIEGAKQDGRSNNYTILTSEENIVASIDVINNNEPAYDAYVVIEHSPDLSFVRKVSGGDSKFSEIVCSVDLDHEKSDVKRVKCTLDNPFKRGRVQFKLLFNVQSDFFLDIKVNT